MLDVVRDLYSEFRSGTTVEPTWQHCFPLALETNGALKSWHATDALVASLKQRLPHGASHLDRQPAPAPLSVEGREASRQRRAAVATLTVGCQ